MKTKKLLILILSFVAIGQLYAQAPTGPELYFYEMSDKGIGEHTTISSGPDNGANNNMRRLFWKAMSHLSTEQAVNNWLTRVKPAINLSDSISLYGAGNLIIGGHGNEGLLETGFGQTGSPDFRTNYMTAWNRPYWEPHFVKLASRKFPIIYIYSCHSGAGERGADFLYAIAQVTGRPAAGRTGFTYSNNRAIWFEKGSVWQIATPDRRPDPIQAPTAHFARMNEIFASDGKKFMTLKESDIIEIKIERMNLIPGPIYRQVQVDDRLGKDVLTDFFGSRPFKIDGDLMAMKTFKLTIKHTAGSFTFDIYNDRIMGDAYGNYYYISPAAKAYLGTL